MVADARRIIELARLSHLADEVYLFNTFAKNVKRPKDKKFNAGFAPKPRRPRAKLKD